MGEGSRLQSSVQARPVAAPWWRKLHPDHLWGEEPLNPSLPRVCKGSCSAWSLGEMSRRR